LKLLKRGRAVKANIIGKVISSGNKMAQFHANVGCKAKRCVQAWHLRRTFAQPKETSTIHQTL